MFGFISNTWAEVLEWESVLFPYCSGLCPEQSESEGQRFPFGVRASKGEGNDRSFAPSIQPIIAEASGGFVTIHIRISYRCPKSGANKWGHYYVKGQRLIGGADLNAKYIINKCILY